MKCQLLAGQLFDDDIGSEKPAGAFICTICYQYFEEKDKLINHNLSQHSDAKSKRGKYVIKTLLYYYMI